LFALESKKLDESPRTSPARTPAAKTWRQEKALVQYFDEVSLKRGLACLAGGCRPYNPVRCFAILGAKPMRLALTCFAVVAAVIVGAWAWLGAPVAMPQAPLEKLYCLSYAPFRGTQTPLDPATMIPAAQIEEDMAQLATLTDCVRVYSTDYGLNQIAGIAARHKMKVLQGLWLSSNPAKNKEQIDSAVALANRYPDTVRAIVVGNEVLLRGDMTANALADTIRAVKARVSVPVTYADVWEFWLRNRQIAAAVDFVTIHILPYWEDYPVSADAAAAHVEAIRRQVAAAFPGKEILIGEVGWPSAGRMRDAALPSPANQARVIQDVLALAKREKFHVNLIEAYDAPWKRALEGTVGGHWGLIDDARDVKFTGGEAVSNHPLWRWQAAGGVVLAALVFGVALMAGRRKPAPPASWVAVAVNALAGGLLIGWTAENVPLESLGIDCWSRSLALSAVAVASPLAVSAAILRGAPLPTLAALIGPAEGRVRDLLVRVVGLVLIATLLLAIHVALGLVFDPRYKDFPFAPLTAAVVPFLMHTLNVPRPQGRAAMAERAGAILLALSVIYIVPNEGLANWQSLWLCAALATFAITLARVRGAPD
jgi:glucan 1,3-beta-glucosidase